MTHFSYRNQETKYEKAKRKFTPRLNWATCGISLLCKSDCASRYRAIYYYSLLHIFITLSPIIRCIYIICFSTALFRSFIHYTSAKLYRDSSGWANFTVHVRIMYINTQKPVYAERIRCIAYPPNLYNVQICRSKCSVRRSKSIK